MRIIGNAIWIIFGGFATALGYVVSGLALCATIVGIPFGFQCFKLAVVELFPFSTEARKVEDGHGCVYTIMNIIWFFIGAIPLVIAHFLLGVLFFITIIGIPFGKQHFKLMKLCLSPFGREIVEIKSDN